MKKGRRMDWESRSIVENRRGRQLGSHRERQKKMKLLAQNFQKVGILFIPKGPPDSQGSQCGIDKDRKRGKSMENKRRGG